jgi:predicted AlkP superfamily phosphohydrolase/phosphomutase
VRRKILFFGFDCASWKVLDPLLEKGDLPNIKKLIEEGVSCRTQAFDPPLSPVLWTSIASSKLPDKHGVKDFLATSKTVKIKRIWNILEEQGFSIGLFGHILTWPPEKVNGFNIPILLARSPETYPPKFDFIPKMVLLEKKGGTRNPLTYLVYLLNSLRYGLRLDTGIKAIGEFMRQKLGREDYRDRYFRSRVLKEKILSDLYLNLYRRFKPDYSFFHSHIADSCTHNFWMYYEPEKFADVPSDDIRNYGHFVTESYRTVDNIIGRFIEKTDPDTLFIVASDHGGQASTTPIKKKSYVLRSTQLMESFGLEKDVNAVNYNLGALLRLKPAASFSEEKFVQLFKQIEDKGSGIKVFEVKPVGYGSIYIELNPQLTDIEKIEVARAEKTIALKELVRISSDRMSGTHDPNDAVLILTGKDIVPGKRLSERSILDILPTLLAWLNLPVAKDMEGKVIEEAFEEKFLQENPIQYIDSYETGDYFQDTVPEDELTEKVKEELRNLGYLD